MMKRYLFVMLMIGATGTRLQASDTITLDWLQLKAREHYPLQKQKPVQAAATENKLKSLDVNYLPQISVNGQLSYQSEVTQVPISIPGIDIPVPDKDVYKISIDISQVIWDGGLTGRQKEIEKAGLLAEQQQLEVSLYQLREKINLLYFNLLLLQENNALLETLKEDLLARFGKLEAGVRNGVVLESQADIIRVEILKIAQQQDELRIMKGSLIEKMEQWTGEKISGNSFFAMPAGGDTREEERLRRPEHMLFEYQQQQLELNKDLLDCRTLPRVMAFGQAGYGRPGLNMLKNEFESFYVLGGRVSWSPWNWKQKEKDRKVLELRQEMIGIQREAFDQSLRLQLISAKAEIGKWESMLKQDDDIVALREKIAKTAASQLDNGIITASDYLQEANQESQARINREAHRIQLQKARLDYLNNLGIKN